MKSGFSATKLVGGSNQEEGGLTSVVPSWLIKYGGAALAVGGLGYLWYRNSSLRAYNQIKDEELFRLNFRLFNNLFLDFYAMGRTLYNQLQLKAMKENIGDDLRVQHWFNQAEQKYYQSKIVPLVEDELRKSEHPKLSEFFYRRKSHSLQDRIGEKQQRGIALTDLERWYLDSVMVYLFVNSGRAIQGLQRLNPGSQGDCFDEKTCLQLLVSYEGQTVRKLFDLFQKMVVQEGCQDLKKRKEAFDSLLEKRLRMESLEAYAVQKLGPRHTELPADEKYHPMILLLNKAFIPPREA